MADFIFMGCCASRNTYGDMNKHEVVLGFLESARLDIFSFSELQRLDTQLIASRLDAQTFDLFLKNWNIKSSFHFFAINGFVNKFELIVALLLFSKETFEKKKEIFDATVNSPQKVMRFLEWRYQLKNQRIPIEISRTSVENTQKLNEKLEKSRFSGYEEIQKSFESIQADRKSLLTYNLLYI
jgi:hypothetical protein